MSYPKETAKLIEEAATSAPAKKEAATSAPANR
jgi:hypothetical protein